MVLDVCPTIPGHASGKQCSPKQADMYLEAWRVATGDSSDNPGVSLRHLLLGLQSCMHSGFRVHS